MLQSLQTDLCICVIFKQKFVMSLNIMVTFQAYITIMRVNQLVSILIYF